MANQKTFLTEFKCMDSGRTMAGPDIWADDWDQAEGVVEVFIYAEQVPPSTVVVGELVESGVVEDDDKDGADYFPWID